MTGFDSYHTPADKVSGVSSALLHSWLREEVTGGKIMDVNSK